MAANGLRSARGNIAVPIVYRLVHLARTPQWLTKHLDTRVADVTSRRIAVSASRMRFSAEIVIPSRGYDAYRLVD